MESVKILLLTFIAVIGFTTMSFASMHIEKVSYHAQQLKQRINREFDKITVNENGMVLVSFYINESGNITVSQSNYSDEKLYETVMQKLENIRLENSSDLIGKEFNYQFKFRVDDGR